MRRQLPRAYAPPTLIALINHRGPLKNRSLRHHEVPPPKPLFVPPVSSQVVSLPHYSIGSVDISGVYAEIHFQQFQKRGHYFPFIYQGKGDFKQRKNRIFRRQAAIASKFWKICSATFLNNTMTLVTTRSNAPLSITSPRNRRQNVSP